ncbi:AAA domain-containing protein [Scenedesmus sp. NREL 46B-D3]|nr:AAA domain-containing protein [Scenedesmus sp. NREL 46B-D3]
MNEAAGVMAEPLVGRAAASGPCAPMMMMTTMDVLTARDRQLLAACSLSEALLRRDPYALLDERGWTLASVDRVAQAFGKSLDERARQVVRCAVQARACDTGDTMLGSRELKASLPGFGRDRRSGVGVGVGAEARSKAYNEMLMEAHELCVVGAGTVVWVPYCDVERSIFAMATRPRDLADWSAEAEAALLLGSCYRGGLPLSGEQRGAVVQAFGSSHLSLVTGYPGCGKSACCDAIAHVAKALGLACHFVAFTWLAANRLTQMSAGLIEATSIHRLVYALKHSSAGGEWSALDVLVLDEASMASSPVLGMLLEVLPARCRLVLVGDEAQLPPIGYGQPFADLVQASRRHAERAGGGLITAPWAELTHVFRSKEPHIVGFAAACRAGSRPSWMAAATFDDFAWHDAVGSAEEAARAIERLLQQQQQRGAAAASFQLLVAGKNGDVGTVALNALAAGIFRPAAAAAAGGFVVEQGVMCMSRAGPVALGTLGTIRAELAASYEVKWQGHGTGTTRVAKGDGCLGPAFVVGDRVMYAGSGHESVRNGERGIVVESAATRMMQVDYGQGKAVWHDMVDDAVQLAYAITVHKYQGNEPRHALVDAQLALYGCDARQAHAHSVLRQGHA